MTFDLTGTTALVTGASAGIGIEFARALAARGSDLVLVARREDRLREVADQLAANHGVTATVISADLGAPGAGVRLVDELAARGLRIRTLVNNAGFGSYGPFGTIPLERTAQEIQLNVGTLVELTSALMPQLLESKGIVVNVASTGAFQPTPGMSVYGATKAFVLSFTEGLWKETEGTGMRVLAVCPGGTESEFGDVSGTATSAANFGKKQTAAEVVAEAMKVLENSSAASMVSGGRNRFLARLVGYLPRRTALSISDSVMGRARVTVGQKAPARASA
ncbi:SDR family oxidoreductase [Microbacteriaceae bacterium VKM Ac-2854]|nr:SDR family oxidoreductase [Microbacteriaceae bacterium VKM Ac-2854]